MQIEKRINLEEPRYDQGTFTGRARHFFITTNPFNILATSQQLEDAKGVVERYRNGETLSALNVSPDQLWQAKHLYDSAYHPDTKEKMFWAGRMSAQVPMNMVITGCMMTFHKTPQGIIFWQWFNQSFNAVVNYTNRSGDEPISKKQLGLSYVGASAGAIGTAMSINSLVKRFPPIVARFVPFIAVAAANCINIPMMRSRELLEGIPVYDADGNRIGESRKAAEKAIALVLVSRICMAAPGMLTPPFIMHALESKAFMKRMPWLNAPVQIGLVGFFLLFATPLCCALFPQKSSMHINHIEKELQEKLSASSPHDCVYFNKGL